MAEATIAQVNSCDIYNASNGQWLSIGRGMISLQHNSSNGYSRLIVIVANKPIVNAYLSPNWSWNVLSPNFYQLKIDSIYGINFSSPEEASGFSEPFSKYLAAIKQRKKTQNQQSPVQRASNTLQKSKTTNPAPQSHLNEASTLQETITQVPTTEPMSPTPNASTTMATSNDSSIPSPPSLDNLNSTASKNVSSGTLANELNKVKLKGNSTPTESNSVNNEVSNQKAHISSVSMISEMNAKIKPRESITESASPPQISSIKSAGINNKSSVPASSPNSSISLNDLEILKTEIFSYIDRAKAEILHALAK